MFESGQTDTAITGGLLESTIEMPLWDDSPLFTGPEGNGDEILEVNVACTFHWLRWRGLLPVLRRYQDSFAIA